MTSKLNPNPGRRSLALQIIPKVAGLGQEHGSNTQARGQQCYGSHSPASPCELHKDRLDMENQDPPAGTLSWRLSSHPGTLLVFLSFRIASLLVYLLMYLFTQRFVLTFIVAILLLSADFYNLKNIAGRRLVGLRWWNEVNASTGDTTMVFESLDPNDPGVRKINATDKRFFWLALYAQPLAWIAMAIVALVRLEFIWLILVVIALILTITNTVAFSRCDKFSQASNLASSALNTGGFASSIVGGVVGRMFR